jgi:hypothetical protein
MGAGHMVRFVFQLWSLEKAVKSVSPSLWQWFTHDLHFVCLEACRVDFGGMGLAWPLSKPTRATHTPMKA